MAEPLDPMAFVQQVVNDQSQADDEAILANAAFIAGKGREYLADWYDRLEKSIQGRREKPAGKPQEEASPDGGEALSGPRDPQPGAG